MTTADLRTSINTDLNLLSADMLEKVSQYIKHLVSHTRQTKEIVQTPPRKIKISKHIKQMSGRFAIPADFDYKAAKAELLLEKYGL